jgi:magnesium transporter
MAADDRADLFAELPPELRTTVLDKIDPEESRDIRQLLAYPDDTAGGLLTTDFVALPASMTVKDAIEQVRRTAEEAETIYQAYAVDSHGTLLGVVSLRELVVARATRTVEDLMNPNIITVDVETHQEEVARLAAKYDLMALPVVDRSHRLVGIITFDDVLDVVAQEATEDAHKLGAVEPLDAPYMTTPFWLFVKARAPWLIFLFVAQSLTGNVLEHYSSTSLASLAMLMWFVPLIISSGGNAGSQSTTLVIRAMALGEVAPRQALAVLGREMLVGAALGATLGALGAGRVLAWGATRDAAMAAAIGLSVAAVVLLGALLGAGIPLVLKRLRIDPALASAPFIASLMDLGGLILYFEIAKLVMD